MLRFVVPFLGAALSAAWLALPAPAAACGGFFCNNALPVNQAAERIIFADNGDGTVTAVVQILYSGPGEDFAWVLPVPGRPDVGVSSDAVFTALQLQTDPQFQLLRVMDDSCTPPPSSVFVDMGGPVDGSLPGGGGGGVMVVDAGTVGPFDFVILSVTGMPDDPADVAVEWLVEGGYDVADLGPDTLRPYLEAGMNLIAFRLTKGSDTGSIRPIVMTYEAARPMIPIRPTAVAAEEDMGVMVWVLGESRALPLNYRHLVLNEARLNWFQPASNYDLLVSEAADEAGGQGFVTEYAEPTSALQPILPPVLRDFLAPGRWGRTDDVSLVRNVLRQLVVSTAAGPGGFQQTYLDGVRDVVRDFVPLPDELSVDDFLRCPFCAGESGDLGGFDRAAFLEAMDAQAIAPVRDADALLASRPYVTRLYTTMSAAEMTVDPEFDFNPDLPAVPRLRQATLRTTCPQGWDRRTQRLTLASGEVVEIGASGAWPVLGGPAALRFEQLSTSGDPVVLIDNTPTFSDTITRSNETVIAARPPPPTVGGAGGCAAGSGASGALLALLALARRRRRR